MVSVKSNRFTSEHFTLEVSGFKGFIISSVPSLLPMFADIGENHRWFVPGKSSCYVPGTVVFFCVAFVCLLCVWLFVFQSKQLSLPEKNRRGLPEAILTPIYPVVLLSITNIGLQCFLNMFAERQLWICHAQFSLYSNFMGLLGIF